MTGCCRPADGQKLDLDSGLSMLGRSLGETACALDSGSQFRASRARLRYHGAYFLNPDGRKLVLRAMS